MSTALTIFIGALIVLRIAQGIHTEPYATITTVLLATALALWLIIALALYLALVAP